jgi:FkbM family methyltransferase
MRATIKRIVKSTIIATPLGHRFFSRVAALREMNAQLSTDLASARAQLVAGEAAKQETTLELQAAHARIRELEAEARRASDEAHSANNEAFTLRASVPRDKRQALDLLAAKGFKPDLIVDVGAAGGTDGLYETWPDAHCVLVEPLAKYKQPLLHYCSRLASSEVIIAAVGAEPGELALAAHPTDPHRLASPSAAPADWPRFSVPMVTVDDLIAKVRAERPVETTLVKIDVDGPEVAVLQGSEQSLKDGRDVYLLEAALLDTDRGRIGEIVNHMTEHGYDVFDIIEPLWRPADKALWQVDLIFVPRASSARSDRLYY